MHQSFNLQYADNTLLVSESQSHCMEVLNGLVAFENISGLKTKYYKSGIIPLNLTEQYRKYYSPTIYFQL